MALTPSPRTWAPNDFVTDTLMNTEVRDSLNFLLNPPRCVLRQTVAQSIPNGTYTSLTFTTEDVDTDGMHDTSTNNTRITCQTAGTYLAAGGVSWTSSGTGRRGTQWVLNGAGLVASQTLYGATSTSGFDVVARTIYVPMVVGDYLELRVLQDTGAALLTTVVTPGQSGASVRWVGP